MKLVAAVIAGSLASSLAAGCASASGSANARPSPSSSPYMLYTHCGIREANIDGRWYIAVTPLSDGSGNPPDGWDNPEQRGTITFRSATEAEFTDAAGHHVLFRLRPHATAPLQVCA